MWQGWEILRAPAGSDPGRNSLPVFLPVHMFVSFATAAFRACVICHKSMALPTGRIDRMMGASCHTALWRWNKDHKLYENGVFVVIQLCSSSKVCIFSSNSCNSMSVTVSMARIVSSGLVLLLVVVKSVVGVLSSP